MTPKLSVPWAKDIRQSVECAPSPMGICGEEIQGNIQPFVPPLRDGMTKMDGIPVNDHRSQ
jgi:hypothetical protein